MAGRRSLFAVVLVSTILHVVSITQTLLPAQDGLKLIRIARRFQVDSWVDVVRDSDAHPLYPALIALAEPVVSVFAGSGPHAWRISAQGVAALAAVALVIPVYGLGALLFDRRIAFMAAGIGVLLPRAAEIGHDTLSDSLGHLGTFLTLWLGVLALRRGDWRIGLGAGVAAGFGYLARPEVILAPVALGALWLAGLRRPVRQAFAQRGLPVLALVAATLAIAGSYALVKGEISEKLALRNGAALGRQTIVGRQVPQRAPRGLDDPRWDFSPKEESDRIPVKNWRYAVLRIAGKWWEELCWFFAVMTVWGLVRYRYIRSVCPDRADENASLLARSVLLAFAAVYAFALVRHSSLLGYLSGRHIVALVYASLPWAAAGTFICARGIALLCRMSPRLAGPARFGVACALVASSFIVQMQPSHLNHLSRFGHWAAGNWLVTAAAQDELVLDTRGWARFVSGQPGYDYWHVRQALTDSHLSYIVVGLDELQARSKRAATLRALLAYSATPLCDFPTFPGDGEPGVRIFRFHRPRSWEGLVR
jgi:4-amino-4-deoxy-L-arabinose transferase-like glycosyltransferase